MSAVCDKCDERTAPIDSSILYLCERCLWEQKELEERLAKMTAHRDEWRKFAKSSDHRLWHWSGPPLEGGKNPKICQMPDVSLPWEDKK